MTLSMKAQMQNSLLSAVLHRSAEYYHGPMVLYSNSCPHFYGCNV